MQHLVCHYNLYFHFILLGEIVTMFSTWAALCRLVLLEQHYEMSQVCHSDLEIGRISYHPAGHERHRLAPPACDTFAVGGPRRRVARVQMVVIVVWNEELGQVTSEQKQQDEKTRSARFILLVQG